MAFATVLASVTMIVRLWVFEYDDRHVSGRGSMDSPAMCDGVKPPAPDVMVLTLPTPPPPPPLHTH